MHMIIGKEKVKQIPNMTMKKRKMLSKAAKEKLLYTTRNLYGMTTKARLSTFARQLVSNKIKYVLYCVSIVLFMVYGIHIKRNTRNDTLCFFYYKGIVNTNTRVSCEDLFKRQKTIFGYSDTVWIDSEDFSKLRKLMKATSFTKQENGKYNSLDVRFIVCSEHDAVGFSDFLLGKCENRQGILLHIDSIFEFSIKKNSQNVQLLFN